ncbi:MAG: Aromatic amino acid permease [Candidatus Uhrbacteria bacterium GW2011_GWE2_45_35]|uniref:Aromatic amino acid permease n=2 Tax=Candidatus Uhriibacteriota TaxID=1752732 RepID=A0A0G1JK24_9BACT|nr:MAG: Aromatic amino acid permease [Candidatus Uhrbacteria bacterium GW2011_GWF2_44_350]KKU08545.1 MAG: Aromatic amino acid permease [Candidatus Uhrbacteria bacterium GW2011_GWE2_45_35]
MIGGMIGVGVFGLPYAFAQSGWALGFVMLLVLGFLIFLINIMYAEINVQTSGQHRLSGYVKKYLGPNWSHFAAAMFVPYAWGAMLAYMLVGGDFLHTLLSPLLGGELLVYQLVTAILAAMITFGGIKKLAKIEFWIICALLFLFVFMILVSLPSLEWRNVSSLHFENWFLPYGVIFFALSGLGVIPEMKDILGERRLKELPQIVFAGQILILILYALFALAVVGVTGPATTPAAFDGLASMFGQTFAIAGSLLGSIIIISIFSVVSIEMQDVFRFDYKINQKISWALASFVPVLLLFLGIHQFVELIGFLGAVFGGVIGILVVVMYRKMFYGGHCKTRECLKIPALVSWLLMAIFAGGIIQTIIGF